MKIVIAGAGSIGCYCGALLADAGHEVTLLGRPRVLEPIQEQGLTVTNYAGLRRHLPAQKLTLSDDPECLGGADAIIVTVKSGATSEMAGLIAIHATQGVPVLSWQNGIQNVQTLRDALPGYDVRAGMVPFNVVPIQPATYHCATSGDIVVQTGPGNLAERLNSPNLPISASDQIEAVQWGKLVINLNNALNALSGLTLVDQLMDRQWRRLMADQMAEALNVLKAASKPVASTTPLPASLTPFILRLPTPIFMRVASKMLTIDPTARTSMAYDLMQGRKTEIDSLQGEVMRLAEQTGMKTPICARVSDLIQQRPTPPMRPQEIRPRAKAVGGR